MTDKQLYVLLDSLLGELQAVIVNTETMLIDNGDVRLRKRIAINSDGSEVINSFAKMGAMLSGSFREEDDPTGRFVALLPLDNLASEWEKRFAMLTESSMGD